MDNKAAYEKVKLVRFTLKPERMKTAKRLALLIVWQLILFQKQLIVMLKH